ncbi:MAG TPA: RluA family pseudouridine synthase [Chitinophagaceae bacterium]|nr:RluA family pseudouridine synthase [Chitinophagaceae bacterium]
MKLDIVFENDDFIVINKPSGLLTIPDRQRKETSLKKILQEKFGKIFTVHRLDRDTSGLVIFAKNETSHSFFSKQFEERQTVKIYLGLVMGSLEKEKGSIDLPIMQHPSNDGSMIVHRTGKESLTDYEVLRNFGIYSWVQFRIHTGRTHQIRVHMKELGHPIVCDELYGDGKTILVSGLKKRYNLSKKEEEEKPILGRLALHAWKLGLKDKEGNDLQFEAPLPKDLRATLQQLEKLPGRR